jgi:membrane-bound lytic murein transglycosylase F
MIRLRYLISLLALVLSCSSGSQQGGSAPLSDQELQHRIHQRISEKKKLDELRFALMNSNLGEAIARYRPIIRKYAKRYGLDWRLITAQIVQESGFKARAVSHKGAGGLMQIMPNTANELSRELDIEFIMKNPRENIVAGIYHLYKQHRYFPDAQTADRAKLALASYNCGVGRVFDAQEIARYYRHPSHNWSNVRPYLALLKESDWQLHLQVWPEGRPKFGYFYGYNETINYVDSIWELYTAYSKIM